MKIIKINITEARFSTDSFILDKPKRVIPNNSPRLVIKSAISIGCLGSIDIPWLPITLSISDIIVDLKVISYVSIRIEKTIRYVIVK